MLDKMPFKDSTMARVSFDLR